MKFATFYHHRYHLRFRHAKKLFFFDMCLVTFLLFLFGATIFWHFYDPTVRSLVSLRVEQSEERIKTGTQISYTLSYTNRSDVALVSPVVTLDLPKGFILNTSTAPAHFQTESSSFTLPDLHPGGNGSVTLQGILFGSPDAEYDTIVKLSYMQEGEETREYVVARLISLPRDTPLEVAWKINNSVLSHGSTPFEIHVINTGKETLSGVQLPLPTVAGVDFQNMRPAIGILNGKNWELSVLPHTTSTLTGNMVTSIEGNEKNITLETTPAFVVNGQNFPQKKITKDVVVLHPSLEASAVWTVENKVGKPLDTVPLHISIQNTGNFDMQNVSVTLPLVPLINKNKLASTNHGTLHTNTFVINKNQHIQFARLKSGEIFAFDIQIPLSSPVEGTDITLVLNPNVQADILEVPGAVYTKKVTSDALRIAGHMNLGGAIRYYTDEGDQLGLGPLPPRIGQETRYFATITLENTTSQGENVNFSATLAPGFVWADKSSVSLGKDIVYNNATRKISWSTTSIPAHTTVGISFGIIFIPSENQVGTTPIALQNISVSATDSFTAIPLSASLKPLDISLPTDALGRNKGVKVVD